MRKIGLKDLTEENYGFLLLFCFVYRYAKDGDLKQKARGLRVEVTDELLEKMDAEDEAPPEAEALMAACKKMKIIKAGTPSSGYRFIFNWSLFHKTFRGWAK